MRMSRIPIAAAVALGVASPVLALTIASGSYVVDDVTNTTPQSFPFLEVGLGGTATLDVLDGRLFECSGTAVLGLSPQGVGASTGTAHVAGGHSRLHVGHLAVGRNFGGTSATGTLSVEAGGYVRADSCGVPDTTSPASGSVSVSGDGSLFEILGSLALSNNLNPGPAVTVGAGGTVSVGTSLTSVGPQVRLDGGTLSLAGPGSMAAANLDFDGGTIRFRSSQTLDGSPGFYSTLFGSPPVLPTGRGLIVDGTTTLATTLALEGGSLRTDRIAVDPATGSVVLAAGTLTVGGDGAVIDDGSDFGPDPLTVGDGTGGPARLELRGAGTVLLGDVTVLGDGALSFSGEALVLDSLDNGGSVIVIGATLDARGGLSNNGSLRLADVVVEGDVTSPAGSTIDVAGTVVFNGDFTGAATFHGSGTVIFNGAVSGPVTFLGSAAPVFNLPVAAD